ncbi:bifunctional hydroxymethylpyrimidine kinase/phosphomethylpyrimidine kinase [Mesobacillus maritimus]|uniref:bifunctional hydroxymethylpyrimidine kinase/phosphomethylpyrimidine kinase n=1 Tax=Mesobacillus maritimus TaxID=1643336 RepID=UPI00203E0CA0|nr:bifunctional hydroxymethylpyrimidine kinase/phosphomethylpyrimidine kinase [Mesobacillus maritimus]MCM3669338.1 bifunctional hydroxymethylpyrimidine kinase/phosphomethylpyrimidine kinase [Mesobacillus maritimus]
MKPYKALTIAGSDSGGGAGIQADLKTFQELHAYGMTALTAVTAQNTLGVQDVYPLSAKMVQKQIQSVGEDIGVDALKTGMLFNAEIITAVAESVRYYNWNQLVVDPVMIAKGGASLLLKQAVDALKKELLPLAMVVTPNIPEAEVLTGINIRTNIDKQDAAKRIFNMGAKHVIIKGGHDEDSSESADLLYDGSEFTLFTNKRIPTNNTHGTGCTFSAAITAELAKGSTVKEAISTAKHYIQAAIENQIFIGQGHGPTNHWAYKQLVRER